MSLPSWERGLKLKTAVHRQRIAWSLPSWERGLKSEYAWGTDQVSASLPSWERGLKYQPAIFSHSPGQSRSPRGSVD